MIGFLLLGLGVALFMLFGYSLLTAPFNIFMNTAIISSFVGMVFLVIFGALWEWYFQKPAKDIIAHRNAAAWEFAFDDLGYAQLLPSKKYLPQGLVVWKFGWAFSPRPIMKTEFIQKLARRVGRKSKNPEDQKKREAEWQSKQEEEAMFQRREQELAEQITLKKCMWKGMGKPIIFQYIGLAANFNPYMLVPSEVKQDNPHSYFKEFKAYIEKLTSLSLDTQKELLTKIQALEDHVDHIRVVINPRSFKEIVPRMWTQSQIEDHGRIHFQLGRLSVTGVPMKYIVIVLAVVAIIGVLGFIFFMFGPKQGASPQQATEQATALIHYVRALL